ncbi:GIY-YIG nuclease family protein [Pseudomonas sp. NPDC088444]|uniref:GIY-YIG nuclease family protein n=1 Tax=Pseudomonas sp. NPDC088444 TaxID=3364456 RepID=UPI00384B9B55
MTEQFQNVELADLAATFDLPATRFQQELALLGWGMLLDEASRLAHADNFDRNLGHQRIIKSVKDLEVAPTWAHLVEAAKDLFPHLASRAPQASTHPPDRLIGYVYVLFDGMTGLCKIGHTKGAGGRQRVQISSHGSVLANVVNAKVPDCLAAEAKCHQHFSQYRENGEWFSAKLEDIAQYVRTELDWLEIDCEDPHWLEQYILHCQSGNRVEAKAALAKGKKTRSKSSRST